jgi:hypothetical protein
MFRKTGSEREPGDRGFVGKERGAHPVCSEQRRKRGKRVIAPAHGVQPLPVRAVDQIEPRRIDDRLLAQKRLGRQTIELGRVEPRVAVRPEKPGAETVDDKDNSAAIWHGVLPRRGGCKSTGSLERAAKK